MADALNFPKLSRYKNPDAFRGRLAELRLDLPLDDRVLTAGDDSPLAKPIEIFGRKVGNRWCIHPMEGWDGTREGMPSPLTLRRWRKFGLSGAKLIFGGEATAVQPGGRANPRQLMALESTRAGLAQLLSTLKEAHRETCGAVDDLLVGLQLTHSGRFCKPNDWGRPEPRILFHHPILDRRVGVAADDDSAILSDAEIDALIEAYIRAARIAAETGFDFVDVKHCHGYLGHEFLGAHTRPGKYGGSLENRTRFLRTIVERVRDEIPGLGIAVRISAFDLVPFHDDAATRVGRRKGTGIPEPFEHCLPYRYGFGVDPEDPTRYDLTETWQLMRILQDLDIQLVNITGGSPYYNPHIQRPAIFPPSDGYWPPEDPLVGVHRHIEVTRVLKQRFPRMIFVGTGYTYLQEFLPHVAQAVIRQGWTDLVGVGRMVLSYPSLPIDSLTSGLLDTKHICRTFSDCTTAPRNALVSGCYPLDEFYRGRDEARRLKEIKGVAGETG
ncbi:MAG: NADH:flavin oxidoreductase [bacterium]